MAKMTISESRLHELIQESIYEVLQEAQYDEGLGHWLGNLWQSAKNKWNNFKGDFNAGRKKAWYDNKDYDSFSHYGDEANNFRNFGGQEYAAHRYNTTVDRNAGARQWARQRYGDEGMPYPNQSWGNTTTQPQAPQGQTNPSPTVQGHPDLGGGQQTPQTPQSTSVTPQQQQPNKLQQVRIDRENQAKQALYKSGMVPQGSKDTITGWVRKDGQQPDKNQLQLIDNWKRVKLYEAKEKLNSLLEQLTEIGDTDRGQYALGKLCKRQEKRDSKNKRETDAYKRASKEIDKTPYDFTADKETFEKNHKKRHNMAMSFDNGYYGRHHKIGLWNEEK